MCRRPAILSFILLLASASIDEALAGNWSHGQSAGVQSRHGHATASRHNIREADRENGTYHSEVRRNKSEWRQAQHRGNNPAQARFAAHPDG